MAESRIGLAEAMPDTSSDGSWTTPEAEPRQGSARTSGEGEDDKIVIARSGHRIDTSGTRWRVGVDHMINVEPFAYEPMLFEGITEFFRQQIRTGSAAYVASQRAHLAHAGRGDVRAAIMASIQEHGFIDMSVFRAFRKSVARTVQPASRPNYLAAFVRFYLFCVDVGMAGFDDDVAAELDAMVIGGNPQGVAVLSHDPNAGPIRPDEMEVFLAKLRDATERRTLPASHLAVAWILVCYGLNSKSVRLLREDDIVVTPREGTDPVYEIRIPRIKKRASDERGALRVRELEPVVYDVVSELIELNAECDDPEFERPLFRMASPRRSLIGTDMESEAFRTDGSWVGSILTNIAEVLDLRNSVGDRLHLTPRRLRYTFATRLVGEGVSPQELADALDHSSTEHILIYFNARLSAVKKIDETIGPGLAPVADAFLGRVVATEAEASIGRAMPLRISHVSPTLRSMRPIGSCDETGDCTLAAPIACYGCRDFIAWAEADHRSVLESLLKRRDRALSNGADPKWTQIHDAIIAAVKEVIRRCDSYAPERNRGPRT